jgi:trehalose utilization protein
MRRRNTTRPTDVYRVYDRAGALLYVGIAMNVFDRMRGHRQESKWWNEAHEALVERYPDRLVAKTEESRAIRDEIPRYNIAADRPLYADDFEMPAPIETLTLFWEKGQVWVDAER